MTVCRKKFRTEDELIQHWKTMGIPTSNIKYEIDEASASASVSASSSSRASASSSSSSSSAGSSSSATVDPPATTEEKNVYNDQDVCVICMDSKRECVYVPCGHLVTCRDCCKMVDLCPICRNKISSVVSVFYS